MEPRSDLFVPSHRPERFAKALASGADAVILDLEDAVDVEHEAVARDQGLQLLMAVADAAQGAVQIDARMIDRPVIEQARRLQARAAPCRSASSGWPWWATRAGIGLCRRR